MQVAVLLRTVVVPGASLGGGDREVKPRKLLPLLTRLQRFALGLSLQKRVHGAAGS